MNKIIKYFSDINDGNLALHIGDDENIVLENRKNLAKKLGMEISDFIFMNQVHSGKSVIVGEKNKGIGVKMIDEILSCDSIVTNTKGIGLSVLVADCIPVLLYDKKNGIIGVVHAGWKGTCLKILENTINNMYIIGAKKEDIKVILGPSISQISYEVGEDVGKYFIQEVKTKLINGKQFLDIKKQNYLDLLDLGIKDSNIEILDIDTFTDNKYYSARRDGFNKGRFGCFIYIK